jgi:Pathogenicity locus
VIRSMSVVMASSKAKRSKASHAEHCQRLDQIPNIGPAAAADLRLLGINEPQQLRGEDALSMYQKLCTLTKQRHDPCVLDTFMAAVDFMNGAAAAPWWSYTAQRKAKYGKLQFQ